MNAASPALTAPKRRRRQKASGRLAEQAVRALGQKRAVLYLRVSDRKQVETSFDDEGNSVDTQRKVGLLRAAELGAIVVDEYVEPGRSATTSDGRPRYLEMMSRIKTQQDVDYVIVYARSRMFRNDYDAALGKRLLRDAGAAIISIKDPTDDNPVGNLVATVLDAVNAYQSEASGLDISTKMRNKVENGGTAGRCPIGYLNVKVAYEGRKVSDVATDAERGPYIVMAFQLYATGTYSDHDLLRTLADAGLRTRPTRAHPVGKPICMGTLCNILRNRYYIGKVMDADGNEYEGRHEKLIAEELFFRVQSLRDAKATATVRERKHNHYLKGQIGCGRCKRQLNITPGTGNGGRYFYFFCQGTRDKSCDMPYLPVKKVEDAVERHYATVGLPRDLRNRIASAVDAAANDADTTGSILRSGIEKEIVRLDAQEDGFLDLVGDPDWPKNKIAERLRQVREDRDRKRIELAQFVTPNIDAGVSALLATLELLNNPYELYRASQQRARQLLNKAFFTRLYVDATDDATPFVSADKPTALTGPLITLSRHENDFAGTLHMDGTGDAFSTSASLTNAIADVGSNKTTWVGDTGIEPVTPAV